MDTSISKLEADRRNGKFQVDHQREVILTSAEKVFLEKGLENVKMSDIAAEAGITRMSLYRYFSSRDPIAFEVAVRFLKRIKSASDVSNQSAYFPEVKENCLAMIDQFHQIRHAYQYIGMFDHLYGDHYPNEDMAGWFKDQVNSMWWGGDKFQGKVTKLMRSEVVMLLNVIVSFLERMAARGELMAGEQEVALEDQLRLFKRMICTYIDDLIAAHQGGDDSDRAILFIETGDAQSGAIF